MTRLDQAEELLRDTLLVLDVRSKLWNRIADFLMSDEDKAKLAELTKEQNEVRT
jgi:hypothetical protein